MRLNSVPRIVGDFCTGMRTVSQTASVIGDFATGMHPTSTPFVADDFAVEENGAAGCLSGLSVRPGWASGRAGRQAARPAALSLRERPRIRGARGSIRIRLGRRREVLTEDDEPV